MKYFTTGVFAIIISAFVLMSCGSDSGEKLTGKWVLKEVTGLTEEQNEIMGVGKVYIELGEDESLTAMWYSADEANKFEKQEGTWLFNEMEVEGGIGDLFLQFEDGQDIIVVKELTDTKLVLGEEGAENDLVFEKE